MNEESKQKNRIKLMIIVIIIFLGGMIFQLYVDPVTRVKGLFDNDAKIVEKVSKLTIVPADEPAVFPVADANILKNTDPVIYAGVENGDFVVIYNDKAIIYRESENKIVNIVNIDSGELGQRD